MPKRIPVYDRGPYLEGIVSVAVPEFLLVVYESRKTLGRIGVASPLKHLLDRIDEKLKSGQPLLAINDNTALNRACGILHLLKNHSAHEVGFCLAVFQNRLCKLFDVVPQRLPLLLLLPHITALKCGYLVTDWLGEKALRAL